MTRAAIPNAKHRLPSCPLRLRCSLVGTDLGERVHRHRPRGIPLAKALPETAVQDDPNVLTRPGIAVEQEADSPLTQNWQRFGNLKV